MHHALFFPPSLSPTHFSPKPQRTHLTSQSLFLYFTQKKFKKKGHCHSSHRTYCYTNKLYRPERVWCEGCCADTTADKAVTRQYLPLPFFVSLCVRPVLFSSYNRILQSGRCANTDGPTHRATTHVRLYCPAWVADSYVPAPAVTRHPHPNTQSRPVH